MMPARAVLPRRERRAATIRHAAAAPMLLLPPCRADRRQYAYAFHVSFRRLSFSLSITPTVSAITIQMPIFIIADEHMAMISLRCAAAAAATLIDAITPMPYYFPAPLRHFAGCLLMLFAASHARRPERRRYAAAMRRIAA
jgi:hypothetical protein